MRYALLLLALSACDDYPAPDPSGLELLDPSQLAVVTGETGGIDIHYSGISHGSQCLNLNGTHRNVEKDGCQAEVFLNFCTPYWEPNTSPPLLLGCRCGGQITGVSGPECDGVPMGGDPWEPVPIN